MLSDKLCAYSDTTVTLAIVLHSQFCLRVSCRNTTIMLAIVLVSFA